MTLNAMIEMLVMENFNPGENMRKMLDIDTSCLEEKDPSTSNRSRPYDFELYALPLSYRRLVGTRVTKLGS